MRNTITFKKHKFLIRDGKQINLRSWPSYFAPVSTKNYFRSLGYAKNFWRKLEQNRQAKNCNFIYFPSLSFTQLSVLARNLRLQVFAGKKDPAFNRTERQTKMVRNFLVFKPLVMHHERNARAVVQQLNHIL